MDPNQIASLRASFADLSLSAHVHDATSCCQCSSVSGTPIALSWEPLSPAPDGTRTPMEGVATTGSLTVTHRQVRVFTSARGAQGGASGSAKIPAVVIRWLTATTGKRVSPRRVVGFIALTRRLSGRLPRRHPLVGSTPGSGGEPVRIERRATEARQGTQRTGHHVSNTVLSHLARAYLTEDARLTNPRQSLRRARRVSTRSPAPRGERTLPLVRLAVRTLRGAMRRLACGQTK